MRIFQPLKPHIEQDIAQQSTFAAKILAEKAMSLKDNPIFIIM